MLWRRAPDSEPTELLAEGDDPVVEQHAQDIGQGKPLLATGLCRKSKQFDGPTERHQNLVVAACAGSNHDRSDHFIGLGTHCGKVECGHRIR